MMNTPTNPSIITQTLTGKEFFAEFFSRKLIVHSPLGSRSMFEARDYMAGDPDLYETVAKFANVLADSLLDDSCPDEELELIIEGLAELLDDYRILNKVYQDYRHNRRINPYNGSGVPIENEFTYTTAQTGPTGQDTIEISERDDERFFASLENSIDSLARSPNPT
jgi:hypothetical protein